VEELHSFAEQLEIRRCWFHRNASYPHYDITVEAREKALQLGAAQGSRKQIIACAQIMKAELQQKSLTRKHAQRMSSGSIVVPILHIGTTPNKQVNLLMDL
jgi:hypothetical protein